MSSSIKTALEALGVGMFTVFVALALVVLTGRMLIRGVNALSPESGGPNREDEGDGVRPPDHAAVLAAAIAAATGGEGRVVEVKSNQS